MLVEDLIAEVENLVSDLTNGQLVNIWNKIFPEETIILSEVNNYKKEELIELRYMILDELEEMELPFLIDIHNDMAENELSIDDVMTNGFENNGFDDEEEDD